MRLESNRDTRTDACCECVCHGARMGGLRGVERLAELWFRQPGATTSRGENGQEPNTPNTSIRP